MLVFKRKGRNYRIPSPLSTPKEIVGRHGHRPAGTSIRWPALYRHLRQKGHSKRKAAMISNGLWRKRHGMPPASLRGVGKGQPGVGDVHVPTSISAPPKKKTTKCRYCKNPATKRLVWADGRAQVPCCVDHVSKARTDIKRHGRLAEIVGVKPMGKTTISKVDPDKQRVWGWAYVTHDKDGELNVDASGEFVDDHTEMEEAAYNFVLKSRKGDDDHDNVVKATAIESMFFSPEKTVAMGIPDNTVPTGWWVGFQIDDEAVWDNVKQGRYTSFSIHGTSRKQLVKDEDDAVNKSSLSGDFVLAERLAGASEQDDDEDVFKDGDGYSMRKLPRRRRFGAVRRRKQRRRKRTMKRDVSVEEREELGGQGHTFRGRSYPVKNLGDLRNAVQAYGRSKPGDRAALKKYLAKEANRLKAPQSVKDRISRLGSSQAPAETEKRKLGSDFKFCDVVKGRTSMDTSVRINMVEWGDDKGKFAVNTSQSETRVFDDMSGAVMYARTGKLPADYDEQGSSSDASEVSYA